MVIIDIDNGGKKEKGRKREDIQNSSPISSPAASSVFFCTSKHLHSHSGYSSSASATGSSLFLK